MTDNSTDNVKIVFQELKKGQPINRIDVKKNFGIDDLESIIKTLVLDHSIPIHKTTEERFRREGISSKTGEATVMKLTQNVYQIPPPQLEFVRENNTL